MCEIRRSKEERERERHVFTMNKHIIDVTRMLEKQSRQSVRVGRP